MAVTVDSAWFSVSDMEAATRFYRAVLGAEPAYSSPYWTAFDAGGVQIGLHGPGGSAVPVQEGGWTLCLACPDLPALVEAVRQAGGTVEPGYHKTPRGALATFADLDGNRLQAVQLGADAQALGG